MAVVYTSNAKAIADANTSLAADKAALESVAERMTTDATRELEISLGVIDEQRLELAQLRQQFATVRQENAELIAENRKLELSQTDYGTRIDEFLALIDNAQQQLGQRATEISQLRSKELEFSRREIDYADRINDLASQLEVAQETNRSLQETVVDLQERLDGGGTTVASGEGFRTAPVDFLGRVIDVAPNSAGQTLVGINAGSNDQLSERMRFTVSRNGRFIATIVLTQVDLNDSVGFVQFPENAVVREGDLVRPTID
jgi:multidrug efflux pump subunit AcrA (membrane-fusion protein)